MSTRRPPADWPRCRLARDANCDGSQISPYGRCLAHLTGGELDQFLGQLGPGSDLDARGTNLSERLVDRLIGAFGSGRPAPLFGTALFSETRFQGAVRLANVRFTRDAWFDGAQFAGNAMFTGSEFAGNAMFTKAEFSADALFTDRASFRKDAVFDQVRFAARADFGTANIAGKASFKSTRFSAETVFSGARFDAGAHFTGARFDKAGNLGPLVARDDLNLDGAVFEQPVLIEAAATAVSARHTVFADATLRRRYASAPLRGGRTGPCHVRGPTHPHGRPTRVHRTGPRPFEARPDRRVVTCRNRPGSRAVAAVLARRGRVAACARQCQPQTTTAGPHPGWLAAIVYSIDSSTSLLSTSQPEPLTEIGNVIQILLKLLGPLLVALALLAVRNRVKR